MGADTNTLAISEPPLFSTLPRQLFRKEDSLAASESEKNP